jgi:hypothetical protein
MRLAKVQFPAVYVEYAPEYPFKEGDVVLLLGEIENMPGHLVVALMDGRVLFGFHPELFRVLTEDET